MQLHRVRQERGEDGLFQGQVKRRERSVMALAITITDKDCAKHLTVQEVAELYREVHMIDEPWQIAKVACDITGKRFVEIRFRTGTCELHDKDLEELLGCDCAVVGQCGTEWYVCGFNR